MGVQPGRKGTGEPSVLRQEGVLLSPVDPRRPISNRAVKHGSAAGTGGVTPGRQCQGAFF